ncbi:hypothetical protein FACS1894216_08110 [Synergistales bacterium]|nr:hypothetical protein FACS1894216_08110 [Synergistales bacterium]
MSDELMTVTQTADYLLLSKKTVRRMITDGRLTASKIGDHSWRIKRADIENYLQAHTNGTKGASEE